MPFSQITLFFSSQPCVVILNDLQKAAGCGEQALALLAESGTDEETEVKGCALRLLGDAALAARDLDVAEKRYDQAGLIFDAIGNRLERGRLLMSLARMAMLRSNGLISKSYLILAQELFEQLGACLDLRKLDALKNALAFQRKD